MSTNVVFNNVTYSIPAEGDSNWGTNVSNYLIAIASGTLQKSSGSFTLLAELDFGATYGIKTAYVKSRATNPAGSGIFRLGNTQAVAWRNAANTSDLSLIVDASDNLTYGGTKITLSGAIVNADIAAGAAIEMSKLAALTASKVLVSDGSGVVSASTITTTTLGYLDATSSIQTQLNGKEATITNLPINKGGTNSTTALNNNRVMQSSGGAIIEASAITAARVLISDANGIPTHSSVTSTTLGYLDATSSIQTQLNAKEGTITNLPINKGGTNSTTALNNNRIMQSSGGAIVEASAITAARVLISDANGIPTHSSITSTTLGYLDATSSVQTQLNAKEPTINAGTTGQYWRGDKSWQTLDKTAVGLSNVDNTSDATKNAAAVQLTNKDYEGGTASNSSRLTVPKNTKTNLDALTRKQATILYGTDTSKLYVDDGSTLNEVGSGGAGGTKNYLGTVNGVNGNGNFELGATTKWALFNTTLTSGIPTGSISAGAASVGTFNTVSSGQLAGTYSLQTASAAAWSAGQGFISDAFTIDSEDKAKAFSFSLYYSVISGSANLTFSGTSTNTFAVYIYDVTNSLWIQPSGVYQINQISGAGYARGTFQTSSNGTQYRVAILAVNASAGAVTMYWDDFTCGPSTYVYGSPTAYLGNLGTITVTAVTSNPTKGTVAVDRIMGSRVGNRVMLDYQYQQSGAGSSAAGSGDYLFALPAGMSFDSATITPYSGAIHTTNVGLATSFVGTAIMTQGTRTSVGACYAYSATTFRVWFAGAAVDGGSLINYVISSAQSGFTEAATIGYAFNINAPILGYSSNVQMSDSTASNIIVCSYSKSATQAVTADVTNITFPNKNFDTSSAFNGTTFTAPAPGYYQITGAYISATTATGFTVYAWVNAVQNIALGSCNSNGGSPATIAGLIYLNANDALTFRPNASMTLSAIGNLQIQRLAFSTTIAATDTVAASYWLSAGFAASTTVPINFDSKEYDYTGSVTTSATAWKFTAPVAGLYAVSGVAYCGSLATTDYIIYKNGVSYKYLSSGTNSQIRASWATELKLLAGDYIDIRTQASASISGAALNSASTARIEITKIGMY